jgi:hypothetical protein
MPERRGGRLVLVKGRGAGGVMRRRVMRRRGWGSEIYEKRRKKNRGRGREIDSDITVPSNEPSLSWLE